MENWLKRKMRGDREVAGESVCKLERQIQTGSEVWRRI